MQWLLKLSSEFLRFAAGDYEPFRARVEELAKYNDRPFKSWFGGKDRIYIPLQKQEPEFDENDQDVISFLERLGYRVDYLKGKAFKDNQQFYIKALLKKLREAFLEKSKNPKKTKLFFSNLINVFNNSSVRNKEIPKNLVVVISQDPHDIGKMSTERRWDSCMTLDVPGSSDKGEKWKQVFCEVHRGGFIAYLIEDDDLEVERPIARILIRRFIGYDQDSTNIALPEEKVYGNNVPGFLETVKNFVNKHQPTVTPAFYEMQGSDWSDTFKLTDDRKKTYFAKYKDLNQLSGMELRDEISKILNNITSASYEKLKQISKIFYSKSYIGPDPDVNDLFDFLFDFFVVKMVADKKYFEHLNLNDSRTVNILVNSDTYFTTKALWDKLLFDEKENVKNTLFYQEFIKKYKEGLKNSDIISSNENLKKSLEILPENKILSFSKLIISKLIGYRHLSRYAELGIFIEDFIHICYLRNFVSLPYLFLFKKEIYPIWKKQSEDDKNRSSLLIWLKSAGSKASFLLPELKEEMNKSKTTYAKKIQFVIECIEQNTPQRQGLFRIT